MTLAVTRYCAATRRQCSSSRATSPGSPAGRSSSCCAAERSGDDSVAERTPADERKVRRFIRQILGVFSDLDLPDAAVGSNNAFDERDHWIIRDHLVPAEQFVRQRAKLVHLHGPFN